MFHNFGYSKRSKIKINFEIRTKYLCEYNYYKYNKDRALFILKL